MRYYRQLSNICYLCYTRIDITNKNEIKTSQERICRVNVFFFLQCVHEIKRRNRSVKRNSPILFLRFEKQIFSEKCRRNLRKECQEGSIPISVTSLSCHPRPRRRDIGSLSLSPSLSSSLSFYPLFLYVILRVLLRAKTSTRLAR